MSEPKLDAWIRKEFTKSGRFVPARLQAALALLERVREFPVLDLEAHLLKAGQSLSSHETYGNQSHERFKLEKINKNHGRRSSSIREWGQELLNLLRADGFEEKSSAARAAQIETMQAVIASRLREILHEDPLAIRMAGRTAEAVISDVLQQADSKGRAGEVAQYLVGAKLQLRFPHKRDSIDVYRSNKGDRRSRNDAQQRRGDFDLGECVIEVAVGAPDAKHIDQISAVLEDAGTEFWLLVRSDRLQFWKKEVELAEIDQRRLVVASVELFVGQNIAELGDMSAKGKAAQLTKLFEIYNNDWIAKLGSNGMRVVVK